MAIRCPACGRGYDVTLFSFGATVTCECGEEVSALEPCRAPVRPRSADPGRSAARRGMREIARGADRIASLFLLSVLPEIDIEIAFGRLRDRALELFPDRQWLFEAVYESRFRRLLEQWR